MTTQPDAAGEFNFDNMSVSVLENATQVVLSISRINGLSGRVTILYRVVPLALTNVATLGVDYALALGSTKTSATIVFEDMQIQASVVVYILNDNVYDPVDEVFVLQLGSATTTSSTAVAKIGTNNTARVTILDDVDTGYVGFDADEYAVSESAPFAVIPIIRESGNSGRVTLMLTLGPGTATIDRDYRKVPGQFVLEDGVTRADFKAPIINDRVFEYPDEIFFIQMEVVSGGAILRRSIAQVTILDDGDTSVPGNCTPPIVIAKTGGAVTLSLGLPVHNGSAKGLLSGYILRLSSAFYTVELTKPPTNVVSLGNLTALTSYERSNGVFHE
uniref:Calx-beta domain-containing protein n=1 Tax=Globisporangium ultimum (strain ATCC 200006 / CBS 805.95 / DAOM BR144) TaxID=431595 RepID=K3W7T1_GLOUD